MVAMLQEKYPQHEVTLLDLADYQLVFSDGRNYFEYEGDTKYVTETLMAADAIVIGTPTFQASIPATLKTSLTFYLSMPSAIKSSVLLLQRVHPSII